MIGLLLEGLSDVVGTAIYIVSYGPVWVVWHFAGKWLYKVFTIVKEGSDKRDADLIMERYGKLPVLREMLLTALYNATLQEQMARP